MVKETLVNVKVISSKSMDEILWTASGKRRNFDE